ncbi:hypothetical protein CAY60_012410 [Shouchella clausii]|jgi:hypothetical protein|uniref:DUF2207 domain-containing protein n=1 Tax=Shouchella rhizosphaerae TaxID=866786 RepID=A0ABZ2CTW6_9BACI|nr:MULTISPECIES: hypothetical protein [Shouchella]MCM3311868.1 hypothetical protein [Psychrobacillus sp. MER TA 17]ALA51923.1 hypothetical protein DB29_01095 [Shouchella clausii]MBU3232052.1 hypothetical protein [Shouchella clausii]MBU3264342.1 hypothetical protein [Shouchella clausii]MBU3508779.1 hypothetical protein [Shouchella clausii]
MKRIFIGYVALLIGLGVLLLYLGVSELAITCTMFVLLVLGSILSLLFKPRKAQS